MQPEGSGPEKARRRPRAYPADRQFAPAALRRWRKAHGLSVREASLRIGGPASGSTWKSWEAGYGAPPYRSLLMILATTGVGEWVDSERPVGQQLLNEVTTHNDHLRRARAMERSAGRRQDAGSQ